MTALSLLEVLTLEQLGYFFFQNVILLSSTVQNKCVKLVKYNEYSERIMIMVLVLMAWCRASVAIVLSSHHYVSSCLWVKAVK